MLKHSFVQSWIDPNPEYAVRYVVCALQVTDNPEFHILVSGLTGKVSAEEQSRSDPSRIEIARDRIPRQPRLRFTAKGNPNQLGSLPGVAAGSRKKS